MFQNILDMAKKHRITHGSIDIAVFLGGKRQLYLVDGGPVRYVGAGGTQQERIKKLTKLQLSRPYYQYLLYTLTGLARIPNSTGTFFVCLFVVAGGGGFVFVTLEQAHFWVTHARHARQSESTSALSDPAGRSLVRKRHSIGTIAY